MNDVDDEVLTAFLLGALDDDSRERVFDRLGTDEAFFEQVAAFEDELILRWYRGQLSPAQREQFVQAYAPPSRQARLRESLAVVRVADASPKEGERTLAPAAAMAVPSRSSIDTDAGGWLSWWRASLEVPRFAFVAVILGVSLGGYVAVKQSQERGRSSPGRALIFATTLSAVGEKALGSDKDNYDRVDVPPGAARVQFMIHLPGLASGALTAELSATDHDVTVKLEPPAVTRTATGATVTASVAARDLPDGDYVLVIRQGADPASTVVSRRPFRVTH